MLQNRIFHECYREYPIWWEAYHPEADQLADLPAEAAVVIVGAGCTGLATALELHRNGIEAVVIESQEPGYGASTRSGGMVGGVGSVKRPIAGKAPSGERKARMLNEASEALDLVEHLIRREDLDCSWHRTGRFNGAWSKAHFRRMSAKARSINASCAGPARVVAPHRLRDEIGTDFFHGEPVTEDAAHLHPALYFRGLKDACNRRGIQICAKAGLTRLQRHGAGWRPCFTVAWLHLFPACGLPH